MEGVGGEHHVVVLLVHRAVGWLGVGLHPRVAEHLEDRKQVKYTQKLRMIKWGLYESDIRILFNTLNLESALNQCLIMVFFSPNNVFF